MKINQRLSKCWEMREENVSHSKRRSRAESGRRGGRGNRASVLLNRLSNRKCGTVHKTKPYKCYAAEQKQIETVSKPARK